MAAGTTCRPPLSLHARRRGRHGRAGHRCARAADREGRFRPTRVSEAAGQTSTREMISRDRSVIRSQSKQKISRCPPIACQPTCGSGLRQRTTFGRYWWREREGECTNAFRRVQRAHPPWRWICVLADRCSAATRYRPGRDGGLRGARYLADRREGPEMQQRQGGTGDRVAQRPPCSRHHLAERAFRVRFFGLTVRVDVQLVQ